jgi:hypothetical protein
MSDLLEDQKIFYIVKDYRRMFNNYWSLKATIDELTSTVNKKDKEILLLRARVNDSKNNVPKIDTPGKLKGIMNEVESQSNSVVFKLNSSIETLNKISKNVKALREIIKV